MLRPYNIGTDIALPAGVRFPPLAAFSIPRTDRLKGAFLMAGGVAGALRNWAPGGADATIVGDVTEGDRCVVLKGLTGYLETRIAETAAMTIVGIMQQVDISGAIAAIGNYRASSVGNGVGLHTSATGILSLNVSRAAGSGGSSTVPVGGSLIERMTLFSAVIPATGPTTLRNHTTGANPARSSNDGARLLNADGLLMRIGNLAGPTWVTGTARMMAMLVYDTALTDAEVATAAAWGKDYAAGYGVVV